MLFGTFPTDHYGTWTILHVTGVILLTILATSCLDTVSFAVVFKICDKRVAGLYITLLATISNLSAYVHKLYMFTVVEKIGIFWTQGIVIVIVLLIASKLKNRMLDLDKRDREDWEVSQEVLSKQVFDGYKRLD